LLLERVENLRQIAVRYSLPLVRLDGQTHRSCRFYDRAHPLVLASKPVSRYTFFVVRASPVLDDLVQRVDVGAQLADLAGDP
jgi:hypothetical protein